jgi:hypothetical protein
MKSYEAIGGDAAGQRIGERLYADYALAGNAYTGASNVWNFRVCYTAQLLGVERALAQHQPEWRAELNRARIQNGLVPVTFPNLPVAQGGGGALSLARREWVPAPRINPHWPRGSGGRVSRLGRRE